MGFLSDLKIKRELKKLEGDVQTAPTPDVFTRLAEIYAEAENNLQRAVDTASEGVRMFPHDSSVQEVFNRYNTTLIKKEIVAIEKKVLNFPSASLFTKLCEKYYQIGDYDKAESYAKTCMREYPDKSSAYIVLGRIYRSRNANAEAVGMYEKACMLDRYNYDALMEYGSVLESTGDQEKALSIYKSILFFAPADTNATEKIKKLQAIVGDIPAAPNPQTDQIATEDTKAEDPFNIEFGDNEPAAAPAPMPAAVAQAAPPAQPEAPPAAPVPPQPPAPAAEAAPAPARQEGTGGVSDLMGMLKEFRSISGVKGSILIDNYGLIIAEDVEGIVDCDLLAAVLTNMLRTIKQHAGPADFGDFKDGFVETEMMNFHLYSIKDVELVVFSDAQTRLGLLEMKVKSFIEKFLEIEAGL